MGRLSMRNNLDRLYSLWEVASAATGCYSKDMTSRQRFVRPLYVAAGFASIVLGVIGIFLPLLPTTPFLLLAAFCFSKGSERWHAWLLGHKYLGKSIRDWNEHGVIRPRAKVMCLGLMVLTMGYTVIFSSIPIYGRLTVLGIGIYTSIFVLTRPSRPKALQEVHSDVRSAI